MDSILIILGKKWPKGFICPYSGTIFYNIRIYSRSQVSVYRTIGPLVDSTHDLCLNNLTYSYILNLTGYSFVCLFVCLFVCIVG